MQTIQQTFGYSVDIHNSMHILRKAGLAICTGVGGNLVMILFLMTFSNVFAAIKWIPWILAFNAAATGYGFIIKTQNRSFRWKIWSAFAGLTTVGITVGMLALYGVYRFGEVLMSFQDLMVYGGAGILAALLGAMLAVKYIKMSHP